MNEEEKQSIEILNNQLLKTDGYDRHQKAIDIILKLIEKQQKEIEQLKENYQILKDDIEGHNIAYVDTPEFEEKYISKDKIREFMKDYQEGDMLEVTGVCKFLLGE